GRASRVAATRALGAIGAIAGAVMGVGVSGGRHFASLVLRAPFVVTVAVGGAITCAWLAPRVASIRHPLALGTLGVVVAIGARAADGYVLPLLYPAFHAALCAVTLAGGALVAFAARLGAPPRSPVALGLAAVAVIGVAACAVATPRAARSLQRATNLRIMLV